ncbi:hypothetical protein SAMN02745146_3144 [Hymenobacter daecheongensis DSM 21074]|uniref:DUF922 domain-containing protein n=1 Tax=Hymenobacter daecheongensis DSM 21074 TaxID=1121955 RepID=A0A1M6J902_9BACT|nr:hypothetical protein [Hymenobacter daecheongensis]SHJ43082.1 hypothetical protein SAMN02745146_3144 [Hymenobacter daecheongensis DSM 21074]
MLYSGFEPAPQRLVKATQGRLPRPAARWLFLVLLLLLGTAAQPPAGPLPPLVLRAAPLALAPQQFYVAAVADARADRRAVAYLLPPPPRPGPALPPQPVDLAGGGLAAIREFVRQSVPRNTALRPVTIRLTECLVTEQAAPGAAGQVAGRVVVGMAFEGQRDDGQPVRLTEYHGTARYRRPAGQLAVVEPTLRQALGLALLHLNRWLLMEAATNPRLAQGVRVTFQDYTLNTDPDTLFYAPGRPLARADFRASPRAGRYAAVVFPSFSFSARPVIRAGFVQLEVLTKVFVVRGSSWMAAGGDEAYTLNHEQRHFDLTKLVAERFKQKIRPANLTVEEFNATIQLAYFTSFQEMNRLQEQYDAETSHGTDRAAQQRWDQRIDAELRAFGQLGAEPAGSGR